MIIDLPDPDRFLDHVPVPAGSEHAVVGPIREQLARWTRLADQLARGSEAAARACRQGFVLTRAQARAAGVTDRRIRTLQRHESWTVVRRGVLSPLPSGDCTGHELAATAAALLYPRTVISHTSAAVVRGVPLLLPARRPTLTAAKRRYQTCTRDDIRVHVADLPAVDVDDWFGAPITGVARTVVDLARARGVAQGVVAADAVLREQVVTREELRAALARQRGWPGVRAARRAVEFADPAAESPLESLARLCFDGAALPRPMLQQWVGPFRVDFLWPAAKVIVETDGLQKYRDIAALQDEKRRQVYLEREGYYVIRLLWDDVVRRPTAAIALVRAALIERTNSA